MTNSSGWGLPDLRSPEEIAEQKRLDVAQQKHDRASGAARVALIASAGSVARAALRRRKSYTRKDSTVVVTPDPDVAGAVRALEVMTRIAGLLGDEPCPLEACSAAERAAAEIADVANDLNAVCGEGADEGDASNTAQRSPRASAKRSGAFTGKKAKRGRT